jgi:hypothetical protein
MLLFQYQKEIILKLMGFVVDATARYCYRFPLTRSRPFLDKVFDVIVVDIVCGTAVSVLEWSPCTSNALTSTPSRNRPLSQCVAVLHSCEELSAHMNAVCSWKTSLLRNTTRLQSGRTGCNVEEKQETATTIGTCGGRLTIIPSNLFHE